MDEEAYAGELAGLLLEDTDELGAYNLALLLGVGDAGELVEEAVGGVDIGEVRAELVAEDLYHLLALALAHEAVVDVHALELPADGLNEQRGDDGAVHAAGEGQQHLAGAYLRAQGLHLFGDELLGELGRGDALHFGSNV